MHITIDARMYKSSGIGTYLQNIIPQIPAEVKLTLLGYPDELINITPHANIVKFTAPIYSITEQNEYKNVIPACDIFWSPHYNIPVFSTKAIKQIVTIHDVYHLAFFDSLKLKQKIYVKFIMNKAVKKSDHLITVSNFSKSEILKYTKCIEEKISVIYNGVTEFKENSNYEETKRKYSLPADYILFVGNVKPHKNLNRLIKAYLLMDTELINKYKLVIVGKKNGFITGDNETINAVNLNPILKSNVIFTGHVDDMDMSNVYKNAALLVFPSIYEGFGLPPLEAMANKCSVLSSSASCMPEIYGEAALYTDPFDEIDMSKKITELLTNPEEKERLIIKGNEQIRLYNWSRSAAAHLKIFDDVITNI